MCHIPFVMFNTTRLSFSSVNTYRATSLTEGTWYVSGETDHLIGSVHAQIKAFSVSHGSSEAVDICWHVFPLKHNLLLFSMMCTKKGVDWSQDTGMLISTGSCQIVSLSCTNCSYLLTEEIMLTPLLSPYHSPVICPFP